jgi:hypothetical protein
VLERLARVDPSQHKIKMVIIMVLKNHSGVNQEQDSGHELGGSTKANPMQFKDKNYYFYNFKTRPGGSIGATS